MSKKKLSDIVPGYPEDHPQTLAALLDADPESIKEPVAWELRHQALGVARSWESHFVTSPWDVLELIVSGYVIHPWEKAWKSYALSSDRQPILVPSDKGSARYLSKATKLLPKPSDLGPLPQGTSANRSAAWLVVYGGSPEVLSRDGVIPGLVRLTRSVQVADIVFFDREAQGQPTLWSVKANTGMSGISRAFAREVPFPDPAIVESLRSAL